MADMQSSLPFRRKKYQSLKECLRKAVWGHENGQGHIAVDAGIDPSILSRWLSEDPNETAGKWVNRFIPLLIALGDNGIEIFEYIGEELRAAQEKGEERDLADAAQTLRDFGKALPTIQKAAEIVIASQGKKK